MEIRIERPVSFSCYFVLNVEQLKGACIHVLVTASKNVKIFTLIIIWGGEGQNDNFHSSRLLGRYRNLIQGYSK